RPWRHEWRPVIRGQARWTGNSDTLTRDFRHCSALVYRPASDGPVARPVIPIRIQAAVLRQPGLEPPYAHSKPLEITELDLARPGGGEILVQIKAAGLCHSDLSVIDGSRPRPTPM